MTDNFYPYEPVKCETITWNVNRSNFRSYRPDDALRLVI